MTFSLQKDQFTSICQSAMLEYQVRSQVGLGAHSVLESKILRCKVDLEIYYPKWKVV